MAVHDSNQSGTVTLTGTSATISVSAYDAAKTQIGMSYRGGDSDADNAFVEIIKLSGTELQVRRGNNAAGTDPIIDWWLEESSSGIDVQEVTYTVSGTSSISAVDLDQSWIQPLGVQTLEGFSMGGDTYTENSFDDTTTVRHTLGGPDPAIDSATLQVVNYDDASVQTVSNTTTAAIQNNAVSSTDLSKTLVIGSSTTGAVRDLDNCPGLLMTSSINLRAERRVTNSYDYTAFVIELNDGSTVQVNEELDVETAIVNFSIAAVDLSRSNPIMGTCTPFQVQGWSESNDKNTQNAFYNNTLTSTTNNRIQTTAAGNIQNPNSQVIEWNDVAPADMTGAAMMLGCNF